MRRFRGFGRKSEHSGAFHSSDSFRPVRQAEHCLPLRLSKLLGRRDLQTSWMRSEIRMPYASHRLTASEGLRQVLSASLLQRVRTGLRRVASRRSPQVLH